MRCSFPRRASRDHFTIHYAITYYLYAGPAGTLEQPRRAPANRRGLPWYTLPYTYTTLTYVMVSRLFHSLTQRTRCSLPRRVSDGAHTFSPHDNKVLCDSTHDACCTGSSETHLARKAQLIMHASCCSIPPQTLVSPDVPFRIPCRSASASLRRLSILRLLKSLSILLASCCLSLSDRSATSSMFS